MVTKLLTKRQYNDKSKLGERVTIIIIMTATMSVQTLERCNLVFHRMLLWSLSHVLFAHAKVYNFAVSFHIQQDIVKLQVPALAMTIIMK